MSRVARYRRQVSEDPDIDNLLSTLSPEEMEQLEKELDAGDPDAGLSAGLRRDQTERASSQREAERESKRLAQAAPESGKSSQKVKEEGQKEVSAKETKEKTKDPPHKKLEETKDTKTKETRETEKPKDERVSKMRERFRQEKTSSVADKDKLKRTSSKKLDEQKDPKPLQKDKAEKVATEDEVKKKIADNIEKKEVAEVQSEKNLDKKKTSDKTPEKKEKPGSVQANKNNTQEKQATDQENNLKNTAAQQAENGSKNGAEVNKDDDSSSIFDELLEKVKNNEAELTELNLNNSDCITIETLMSFTEALEFNTVVKIFSLANTRADDHIALVIAAMLKSNKTITSINLDSNQVTGKGILAIFRALQHNDTLTELRFHNQRHICGGKTEMEIAKMLKENTTLLKLGYHFELAGPRMTVTNLLSRNMDKQRQRRMAEQKALKEAESKKNCLAVPKIIPPPEESTKSLRKPAANNPQKGTSKKGGAPVPPPPPPPMAPLAPPLINENIRNSLSPASKRRIVEKTGPAQESSRDKLLESIRSSNVKQLKKVEVPKWLK
ncbi:leiomodin-1-like [Bufo gargarizans]|uniref:leiomodin-1-like n=1 Tax=Bufo gargarizans TaxID=30331 RepID=UPI001CF46841|nr:leiomodin-1-like [Bufo gargarizans]